ncbi:MULTISPECIES: FAD-binding and (Fe-S)-binding domain-containing protein [Chromohalobacter]|uniref:D-2-hydroxyglutarate dehydrogenase n=1 Tax=Chromohalobacter israelensis (strain ATCC BAA-138 / DSM 3043 / CIP 106854 / NCIMB 13768 / 1H11) TaxID=290398 RepID=Q1QV42_CHRI1|nr:FAD-binding and (Fe-S)-binding domain-containing protein [Chromohalobacter salexigens]ABE59666.1 FAD linked oxidase-like protein [Chromohalobacter salexigens DSM 3043]NWO57098.1 FAD-binding oxidoreductase [Chromohalobacter salexigens]
MIAPLDTPERTTTPYLRFIEALDAAGFRGDIAPDYANRTVLATDNSIYQRLPQAVLYPRDAEDLAHLARLAAREEFQAIVLTPRGGGTGTNGQSLTDGLVVDVSRYMNRILEIDAENRRVRVQAGVVKDQLNAALKPYGLFFAPDLSTSNRATIGGMISTDASGQGSCEYGKTRDHVLALDMLLLGGERLHCQPLDADALDQACARDDRIGDAHRTAREIADTQGALIEATFPPLNRCLTGYDLAHLRRADGTFDLNSVLCGSEGTLGFLAEATLNVLPIPKHSTLVNIRYRGFMDALRDAKALMSGDSRPTSIETVDDKVLTLAMEDFVWDSVAEYFPAGEADIHGINLVEFNDDDPERLAARVEAFCTHLGTDTQVERLGHTLAEGREAITRVYAMRKRAVGLLGNAKGEKRPIPFVEDTAVPPEHLADYIAEFRALLDAHGLAYGMFGHVDAGVLHVRPAIDMKDPEQATLIRTLSDEVAALTQRYHGLLWGEHGKGVRSEYAPQFFGELYPSLQRLKAAFDPHNQLNPGKIATPLLTRPEHAGHAIRPEDRAPDAVDDQASKAETGEGPLPGKATVAPTEGATAPSQGAASDDAVAAEAEPVKWVDPGLLTIDGVTTRGQLDRQIDERVWQHHASAVYCNGNGACYNYDPNDAMCPSWKATRERIHSPKGRASLMREWLRLQNEAGIDVVEASHRQKAAGAWDFVKTFPRRARNTLAKRRGREDVSHDVYDAMAGCLACKSCAGQCPIKVNVPEFRSQFLALYHGRYLRPPRDYLIGALEFFVPYLKPVAPLYNALLDTRLADRLLAGPLGMVDTPRLSRASLARQLEAWGIAEATPTTLGFLSERQKARSVVIVQDAFTSHFEAKLVMDIVELLSRLDIRVFVAPFHANGKPLHVQGFLGAFEKTAARQARRLRTLADFGVPLVGIDPAMTLAYRQEYVKALGPEAVPEVLLLQEWLVSLGRALVPSDVSPVTDPGYKLLTHCTEKTNAPGATKAWQQVFAAFGLTLESIATGCCGMSGTYGHEARNRETSETIYDLSWRQPVEDDANAGRLLATGYSCRSQAQRLSEASLPHPLQGLLVALKRAG